jgi:hypothetical protein
MKRRCFTLLQGTPCAAVRDRHQRRLVGGLLEKSAEDCGGVFAKLAVVRTKGSEKMGIDVELTGNLAIDEDGNNDFRFSFESAGEVARIGMDVVHNDGFTVRSGGAADSLIQRDAGVGSHRAFERPENEHVAVPFFLEHVEADPVVAGKFFVKEHDDSFHECFARGAGRGEGVEFQNQIGSFYVCRGHGE